MVPYGHVAMGVSLLFLSGFHSLASADPISFSFTTTLTGVSPSAAAVLTTDLHPGDSFVGFVSFEVTGPDETSNPGTAIFPASGSINLPFVQIPMQFVQVILAEANPQVGDFVGFAARDPRTFPGPFEGLFSVAAFQDPAGTLLTSTDVPDVSVLRRFPGGPFQAFTISTDTPFTNLVVGTLTATETPAPVPEPSTVFLLATGAAGLAVRMRWPMRAAVSRCGQE
jgi:hypothetical protein